MLNAIRKQAGSWIVKVLLLLLVVSFAVWGIGDIFYGSPRTPVVATVGDSDIHASELANEFNRQLNAVQQQLGTRLDREQAIRLGLMQQALHDLVGRRLVDLRARDMGLTVDEDTLRRLVTTNPAFQTAGRFDRNRFQQVLFASGMSEEGYLAALRQDIVRASLTESLTAPVEVPTVLVEALYQHRNEQRAGRALLIDPAAITDLPEPGEEELQAFHAENEARFTAPAYRSLTYIALEPQDLVDEIQVSEEEVQATYEERGALYRTPERRTVEQLLASEQEVIEQAAARVAEGASFAEVADELAASGVALSELGEVTPDQLPGELNDPIFALGQGEVSPPVQSPFGWHLFHVTELQPEQVEPFEAVREDLERELALEEAAWRLPALANALDDELAAGVSLEEAAPNLALETRQVPAIDAQGLDPEGEPPADMPPWESFVEVAFDTPPGEVSFLEETEDGSYFVLRVDQVTPSRVRPLDEVRDQVIAAWSAESRRELARERAQALLGQIREGAVPLDQAAADPAVRLVEFGPLRRNDQGYAYGLGPAAVRALFATPQGEVATTVIEVGGAAGIVATDQVTPADPTADPDGLERLAEELRREMRQDLVAQFGNALRETYPVTINQAEVARLTTTPDAMLGGASELPRDTSGF